MPRFILLCLAFIGWATATLAHEVRPAIANLTNAGQEVSMVIRFGSIEPILAGVNLQGVADTNETDAAEAIDALRALSPDALAEAVRAQEADILARIQILAPEAIALRLDRIEVDDEPDVELPRETRLFFEGTVGPLTDTIVVTWPAAYGVMILRQMGVEDGYTGFMTGLPSEPITLARAQGLDGVVAYTFAGFGQILPHGVVPVLFVLALMLMSTQAHPLGTQVGAFAMAHLLTLVLGTAGGIVLPADLLAPLLAVSLVVVGGMNLLAPHQTPEAAGTPPTWRLVAIFVLGLLHGLGFAAAFTEIGVPESLVPALAGFAFGIALGVAAVLALGLALLSFAQRSWAGATDTRRARVLFARLAASGLVAGVALTGPVFAQSVLGDAPLLLWVLAALCSACLLATFGTGPEAYRQRVSLLGSMAIAGVGLWLLVQGMLS